MKMKMKILVLVLLAGCVTLTESEMADNQHERENELIQASENLSKSEKGCRGKGGMTWVKTSGTRIRRASRNTAYEMRNATCGPPLAVQ